MTTLTSAETLKQGILGQLWSVMTEFDSFDSSVHDDFSGGSTTSEEIAQFSIRSIAAIERIAGKGSVYYAHAMATSSGGSITNAHVAKELYGIISALYHDVQADYVRTTRELIHADLFANFLSMGDYLLGEGYKDAAAVIVGGVLETHIRQLAEKYGIDPMNHSTDKDDSPKKVEVLNQELGKSVYGLLQQKSVTAWLDIRNNGAHVHYDQYDNNDVRQFSQALEGFIEKYPA